MSKLKMFLGFYHIRETTEKKSISRENQNRFSTINVSSRSGTHVASMASIDKKKKKKKSIILSGGRDKKIIQPIEKLVISLYGLHSVLII
jgi:hypothetical protein